MHVNITSKITSKVRHQIENAAPISKPLFFKIALFCTGVFLFCEYLIYYIVLFQCYWPAGNSPTGNIKAMFIADPHLLGPFRGNWFDKLRREWQMYRTFQTAIEMHQPEYIFVLGDLLDEGEYVGEEEFQKYVARFYSIFDTPPNVELYVVPGNHDMGFHYRIQPYLNKRFSRAFNSTVVKLLEIKGINFILINSMALEGDGCFLCQKARKKINELSVRLRCTSNDINCHESHKLGAEYSQPILLQHFPLYRQSDAECSGADSASDEEKKKGFRPRWECISKESTDMIFDKLNPRLIIDGHTHNGCVKSIPIGIRVMEYTVASFSWRNRNNPSFLMATISPQYYNVSKCYIPEEITVLSVYAVSFILIVVYILCQKKIVRMKKKLN